MRLFPNAHYPQGLHLARSARQQQARILSVASEQQQGRFALFTMMPCQAQLQITDGTAGPAVSHT